MIINHFLAREVASGATPPSILGFGLLEDKCTLKYDTAVKGVRVKNDGPGNRSPLYNRGVNIIAATSFCFVGNMLSLEVKV